MNEFDVANQITLVVKGDGTMLLEHRGNVVQTTFDEYSGWFENGFPAAVLKTLGIAA